MSKWSLKGMFSKLTSKSEDDINAEDEAVEEEYSADDNEVAGDLSLPGMSVSPLAMMDERKPEAWLGNFLVIIGAPPAIQYSTLSSAKDDAQLITHLKEVREKAMEKSPLKMLDAAYADALKDSDWSAWWHGQEDLGRYAYSVLALAMLGNIALNPEVAALYKQDNNSRIRKDAHYTVNFLLGKRWPDYQPTESDLVRLSS
ncbi:MAG: hypothetical protein ABIQ44_09050 [Chloroflexia bacterium]